MEDLGKKYFKFRNKNDHADDELEAALSQVEVLQQVDALISNQSLILEAGPGET